jgi:SCP-2 sterol transfer family
MRPTSRSDTFSSICSPGFSIEARARRAAGHGPVVDGDADDRTVEQPAGLEPVKRMEVITFARSPVIRKITKTSATPAAGSVPAGAGRVIVAIASLSSIGRSDVHARPPRTRRTSSKAGEQCAFHPFHTMLAGQSRSGIMEHPGGRTKAMAQTTAEFFDALAARGHDPLLEKVTGTIRFDVKNNGRIQRWRVAVTKGEIDVSRSNGPADSVVTIDRDTLDGVAAGKVNAFAATLRGKISIEGDPELMVLFLRVFREERP